MSLNITKSVSSKSVSTATITPSSPPPLSFIGSFSSSAKRNNSTCITSGNNNKNDQQEDLHHQGNIKHLYVLPVLLLEFLALALTRAVIPTLLIETFHDNVYFVMGCAECVRGLLAFVACPMFGKISDHLGRKVCLFITVLGTCSPACSLALLTWKDEYHYYTEGVVSVASTNQQRMYIFVILLALSGIFSSTFTLTFAYISDTVKRKRDRVSAYGLALATFGLSFTIGPLAGGYLAHVDEDEITSASSMYAMGDIDNSADFDSTITGPTEIDTSTSTASSYSVHPLGQKRVFMTSLILTIIDLLYIYFVLPESISRPKWYTTNNNNMVSPLSSPKRPTNPSIEEPNDNDDYDNDSMSIETSDTRVSISDQWNYFRQDVLPNAWSPFDTLKIFSGDPFMYEVGCIAFLYYTSLWAVVSTLMLYAVKRFGLGPERLGELMSALGLSTMISEAVLVRMIVPAIGEKRSMRLGLAAFFLQCIVLGLAYESWQLFICVLISMMANLVYPSLTSMVSSAVAPEMIGEALGAINGVKALTEGVGPLVFGTLLTLSEKSMLPGWPYLVASIFALIAYNRSANLPNEDDEDYISEKYTVTKSVPNRRSGTIMKASDRFLVQFVSRFAPENDQKRHSALSELQMNEFERSEDEYIGLLSEVEEISEDEIIQTNQSSSLL